jgi:hypothetical protein
MIPIDELEAEDQQPKPKNKKKVRNIILEDSEEEIENIVLKKKPRGRPVTKQIKEEKQREPDINQLALKQAIQKQTNHLLYSQLFSA